MNITPIKKEINTTEGFTFKAANQEVLISSLSNNGIRADFLGFSSNTIAIGYKSILSDIEEQSTLPLENTLFFFPISEKPTRCCNLKYIPGIISYSRECEYRRITPACSENISTRISDDNIEKYYQRDIDAYKSLLKPKRGMLFIDTDKLKIFNAKVSFFMKYRLHSDPSMQALTDFNDYVFRFCVDSVLDNHRKSLRLNSKYRILRKAIDIINGHPYKNYTVMELCEEANISIRALQIIFKQVLDISPKKYLTNIRLSKIRRNLLTNHDRTIKDICQEYGVVHLGNFSKEYKRLFGEPPSQTRAKS